MGCWKSNLGQPETDFVKASSIAGLMEAFSGLVRVTGKKWGSVIFGRGRQVSVVYLSTEGK